MLVSPTYDISTAGSLASATLCGQSQDASAPRMPAELAAAPRDGVPAPQKTACKSGGRRWIDALLSPISGPTFERRNSGASNI